jgi:hypothetical protein
MTPEPAREIIAQQFQFGGGYNRNAVRLLLGEVRGEHGQETADGLVREFDLEVRFGLEAGTDLSRVGRRAQPASPAIQAGVRALRPDGQRKCGRTAFPEIKNDVERG